MLDQITVEAVVEQEIRTLLMESADEEVPLTKQDQLHKLGLNSLLLARLIVQLDTILGVEPFSSGAVITDVRAVGDLVTVYETAYAKNKVTG